MSARQQMQLRIMRLVISALDRGDIAGAAEAARGVYAMLSEQDEPAATVEPHAVSRTRLAKILDCTPRHIANLERRGQIAAEATLGSGAGKRYIVEKVFASLGRAAPPASPARDEIAEEGREAMRRRARLRVVGGSS